MSGDEEDSMDGSETHRRDHHNELERRRRDHIKESFDQVKQQIPHLQGQKASRSQVLKQATEYVATLKKVVDDKEESLKSMEEENEQLQRQIDLLAASKRNS